jgi:beta-mannosidase
LPSLETLAEMFPEGVPASLTDRRWAKRKAQVGKLLHYAGERARLSLSSAVEITQRVQATALQVGLEQARLRRPSYGLPPGEAARGRTEGALSGGVAFWQFNEPWRAVSWSVIDGAGRPKAAYEMLRRSYQPLLIAATFPWRAYAAGDTFQADVWLVNDGLDAAEGCCATADMDGRPVWGREHLTIYPASVQRLGQMDCRLAGVPLRLGLTLTGQDGPIAANEYDLGVPLPPERPVSTQVSHWLINRFLKA